MNRLRTCLLLTVFLSLISVSLIYQWQTVLLDEVYSFSRKTKIVDCEMRNVNFRFEQRGDFYVFYNFVTASKNFSCYESITYATQGDYSFLDNIPVLVERWKGPISVCLYTPGDDFASTLESIAYLRNCESPLIKDLVTFHVFFNSSHTPHQINGSLLFDSYDDFYQCSKPAPYKNISQEHLYKRKNNLTYPINVARNIARRAATTYFILATDIELYPTPNFISKFLRMLALNPEYERRKNPRVYALPIFEISSGESVPNNKTALQNMLNRKKAFLFHQNLCPSCHAVPNYTEWKQGKETDGLEVFAVSKRMGQYKAWEAFYVGTHADPLFDERMSWEGQSDKMSQRYAMCLLNYDFMVLDNAFLVHKPGVKKQKEQIVKYSNLVSTTNRLRPVIKRQLNLIYGVRNGCYL